MFVGRPCWSQIIRFHHRVTEHFPLYFLHVKRSSAMFHWNCNFYTAWKTVLYSLKKLQCIVYFLAASWSSVFSLHCRTKQCKTERMFWVAATTPLPPPVTQIQNLHLRQDEQQIMRAVQLWSPNAIDMAERLCTEHRIQEEALQGSLG